MATLLQIRTALNGEVGVGTDAETSPWSVAVRNQAISDAYADLWRVGVWKDATQNLTSSTTSWTYALTSIRKVERLEVLDGSSQIVDLAKGRVELTGAGTGAYQLRLLAPLAAGFTIRVRGWAPYVSVFASDAATDDLPAEHGRIPRLKAKAILYRIQLGTFARYQERVSLPSTMAASPEILLNLIAACEREYEDAAKQVSNQRPRVSQLRGL